MDELTIRFASIGAKLKALKSALDKDQLLRYNESILESKTKVLKNLKENDTDLSLLIEELFQ